MKIQVEVTDEQGAALQAEAAKTGTTATDLAKVVVEARANELLAEQKRYAIYAPVRAAQAAAIAEEIRQGLREDPATFDPRERGPHGRGRGQGQGQGGNP